MGKRARRRKRNSPTAGAEAPFVELGLPANAEVYEVAPGIMGIALELHTAQAGGAISEIRKAPEGGTAITVGRPLLAGAVEMLDRGEASSAVMTAHTASEIYVRYVIRSCAASRAVMPPEAVRSYAMHPGNSRLVALYEEITDDKTLRRAPFWTSGRLSASVRRRNRIAHSGYVCSPSEARETLATLNALHTHLEAALERTQETASARPSAPETTGRPLRK